MKRQTSRTENEQVKIWTYPEAVKALPYVSALLRSLREYALEFNRCQLQVDRVANKSGRRNRDELIDLSEYQRQLEQAHDNYREALDELLSVGVGCVDPIEAEAIFPFLYDDRVAWFTYSLFEGGPIRWWRFDSDSPETRRLVFSAMKDKNHYVVV